MNPTSSEFVHKSIQCSSIALLYYDYSLTFNKEIQFIWNEKLRLSTVLYFLCRYAMISNIIYIIAISTNMPKMSCDSTYRVCSILSLLGRTAVLVVWTARTSAIYGHNKLIIAFLGFIVVMLFVLAALHISFIHCTGSTDSPIAVHLLSIFTVVFELVSTLLTIIRTIQTIRVVGSWKKQKESLVYFILQQGIIYFILVSTFSTMSLILDFTAPSGSVLQTVMSSYTIPISGLMSARFILHLREFENPSDGESGKLEPVQSPLGSIEFERRSFDSTTTMRNSMSRWSWRDFGVDPVRRRVEGAKGRNEEYSA
ncbi:hypothetical protein BDQ17DRAFT_1370997, partial [Cyathus striatus]